MDRASGLRQDGRMIRRLTVLAIVAAAAFGVVTLYALEGHEVVVVRTHDAVGTEHATRTWIADADGAAWIEAANPERQFLHDLEREPTLTLDRGGRALSCRATIAPNPAGHARIRDLLAARYGWADCWIAMVADTRRSLAVRLECDGTQPETHTG
jgi:hypothetical protein